MFRFFLDFFRFPFMIDNPKNKFGQVLSFVIKEFPAYFFIKPKLRKILIFPFVVIHMIVRQTKYEKFGFRAQTSLLLLLMMGGFAGYYAYYQPEMYTRTYRQKRVGHYCALKHYGCGRLTSVVGVLPEDPQQTLSVPERLEQINQALIQRRGQQTTGSISEEQLKRLEEIRQKLIEKNIQ